MKKSAVLLTILIVAILLNCVSCGKQDEPTESVSPSESETLSPTESELPTESETETESEATEPETETETEPETEEEAPMIEPIGEYASAQDAFAGLPAHYADYPDNHRLINGICENVMHEAYLQNKYSESQALFFNNVDDFAVEILEEHIVKVYAFGMLYKINCWIGMGNNFNPYFIISDDFAVLCKNIFQCAFVYKGGYEIYYPPTYDEQNFKYNDDIYFYSENGEVHYEIHEWFVMSMVHSFSTLLHGCGTEFFPDQLAMETGTVSLEDGKIVFNMENTYTIEQWSHLQNQDLYDKYNCDTLQELVDIYREYEQNGKAIDFWQ